MTDSLDPESAAAEHSYFSTNPPPATLEEHTSLASAFIDYHAAIPGRRVALVTSGGTTVPLERNTVRFIDNFSAGTRGATSAEYFLEAGYAVIFLHRKFSLLPFARHYSHSGSSFLDCLAENPDGKGGVVVAEDGDWGIRDGSNRPGMLEILRRHTAAKQNNMILMLPFVTITEYLYELRAAARLMRPLGSRALMYLAAAPSDFFLPPERMSEHKIQSTNAVEDPADTSNASNKNNNNNNGRRDASDEETFDNFDSSPRVPRSKRLIIDLDPVPKFLKNLVDGWAPEGFFVSFKLETDPAILVRKARLSLARYCHHLVVGNLLATRKWEVVFVAPGRKDKWLRVPPKLRRRETGTGVEGLVGSAEKAAEHQQQQQQQGIVLGEAKDGKEDGKEESRKEERKEEERKKEVAEGRPIEPDSIPSGEPLMEIEGLIIPAIQELHDEHIRKSAAPRPQ